MTLHLGDLTAARGVDVMYTARRKRSNRMNDTATSDLDQAEQEVLNVFTYEISDETLEAAASTETWGL